LTANYLMMNPYTAMLYGTKLKFKDSKDSKEWLPGRIEGYPQEFPEEYREDVGGLVKTQFPKQLPAAGILTSPSFLARYPSTDTNRNRARARWTYYFFLGVDIEGLATRPMTAAALQDRNNPTLNNANCAGCHQIMDPVAGAFQSWGNEWFYNPRYSFDALAPTYVDQSEKYQPGDTWYRDMRHPGYNGKPMPVKQAYGQVQGYEDGLQWLAKQLVKDPRFATGTVKFWWPAVVGTEILPRPERSARADKQRAAYLAQQKVIQDLAVTFIESGYNLKDLLVAMTLSPESRTQGPKTMKATLTNPSKHLGYGQLLTPEMLATKYAAVIDNGHNPWVTLQIKETIEQYYLAYGGIDSDAIEKRATELNPLMGNVAERIALEWSCAIVQSDFNQPKNLRVFFHQSDLETTPTSNANQKRIQKDLSTLAKRIWGRTPSQQELVQLYSLFEQSWNNRQRLKEKAPEDWGEFLSFESEQPKQQRAWAETCYPPNEVEWEAIDWDDAQSIERQLGSFVNPSQTVRPWSLVLAYLLTDPLFLYQ